MSLAELFESWTDPLPTGTGVKAIYGDPIETNGKTIIPVARVSFGFGAGGRGMRPRIAGDSQSKSEQRGGRGGASAFPIGVLEVRPAATRFIPTQGRAKLVAALAVGSILGTRWGWRARRKIARSLV